MKINGLFGANSQQPAQPYMQRTHTRGRGRSQITGILVFCWTVIAFTLYVIIVPRGACKRLGIAI